MKAPCFGREKLFAYSNRLLGPREAEAVRTHVEGCAACRTVIAGFDRVSRVLDEWKPAEPSPWFDARARARLASAPSARRGFAVLGGKLWATLAATTAAAVVLATLIVYHPFGLSGRIAPVRIAKMEPHASAPAKIAARSAAPVAGMHAPEIASTLRHADTGVQTLANARAQRPESASQEIALYENLNVLENYDMLSNFDVLSELPQASDNATD